MIDRITVQRVLAEIKRAADYRFFFEQIQSADWVVPLANEGIFGDPPGLTNDGSNMRYPPWPASRYLARVAAEAPNDVAQVIHDMPKCDNPLVHADLIRAVAAMPVTQAVPLIERVKRWARVDTTHMVQEPALDLAAALFRQRAIAEAIDLSMTVLAIPLDEETAPGFTKKAGGGNDWYFEQGLQQLLAIVPDDGVPALLKRLSDGLGHVLAAELGSSTDRFWRDHSSTWCSTIEEHEQKRHYDSRCWLVDAIRDLALRLGASEPQNLPDLADQLLARRWAIFARLALHLAREFPEHLRETTSTLVLDPDMFELTDTRHEYYWVVRETLAQTATEELRRGYLSLLDAGPPAWLLESYAGSPDLERAGQSWIRDRLHPIREVLPEPWSDQYDSLVADLGEPDHPDFLFYMGSVRSVGGESPLAADELLEMSVEAITDFLEGWTPTGDFAAPSIDGLGRSLAGAVAQSPAPFAIAADQLQVSEPTYVRSVLDGFKTATDERRCFDWAAVLALCTWVLGQSDEGIDRDDWSHDPDWSWARKSIASLVASGLDSLDCPVPTDQASLVWDVLGLLAEDLQPSPDHEERYGESNMDPITLSLNTIRGSALHAVIRFLLWLVKNPSAESGRLTAETLGVLDSHLDTELDPSLAVRSVYGWGFGDLITVDPDWTKERVVTIYPSDASLDSYRRAAWDGFLMRWRPSRQFFELLEEQYELAVERMPEPDTEGAIGSRSDSAERLASHLLTYYWWDYLDLDDSGVWSDFMERAGDELRAFVIHEIARALGGSEDLPVEVVERSMQLWQNRLAAVSEAEEGQCEAEMGAIVWWFEAECFDSMWLFEQFLAAAEHVTWIDAPYRVMDRLVEEAAAHPALALKVLRVLIDKDQWGHVAITRSSQVREVLSIAMGSGDESRGNAITTIDWLVARGLNEYVALITDLDGG